MLQPSYIGRDAAGPTMGVDKDGVAFYAAGAFDAFGANGAAAKTKVYRSTDNGISWQDTTFGAAGQDFPPTTLDPYVYVDSSTGRVFSIDLAGAGVLPRLLRRQGRDLAAERHQRARRQRPPDLLLRPAAGRQPAGHSDTGHVPERHLLLREHAGRLVVLAVHRRRPPRSSRSTSRSRAAAACTATVRSTSTAASTSPTAPAAPTSPSARTAASRGARSRCRPTSRPPTSTPRSPPTRPATPTTSGTTRGRSSRTCRCRATTARPGAGR